MNMQVQNFTTATAIPASALTANEPEPIISMIEAYYMGVAAYNALPEDQESEEDVAATYGPAWDAIVEHTPEIHTTEGAVAAIRFALKEEGFVLDSHATGPLITAALRFLESATGGTLPTLVHPDAELLVLGQQLDALYAKIDLNCAADSLLTDGCNAVYYDVPAALIVTEKDVRWFNIDERPGQPWNQEIAKKIKPPSALVYFTSLNKIKEIEARAAEIRQAAKEHGERYKAYQLECGATANEEEYVALCEELDSLMLQAMAIQPQTVPGFIVQAKIVKRQNTYWLKQPTDLDIGEQEIVGFVNNMLALEGGVQ